MNSYDDTENDKVRTRVMITYFFHNILIFKVMHFVFFYFVSHFIINEIFIFFFPFMKNTFLDCKHYVGAGKNTLMSVSDGLGL